MSEDKNNIEQPNPQQIPQSEAPEQIKQSEQIPDWQLKTINVKRGFDTLGSNKDKIIKKSN